MTNIKNNRPTLRKDPQGTQIQEFANNLTRKIDYAGGFDPVYVGYARPGTAIGDAEWQIMKFEYDVNGNVTSVTWASGDNDFRYIWSSRATYTYA